jgi:hypothetical protein
MVSLWERTGGANPTGVVQSLGVSGENGVIADALPSTGNVQLTIALGNISPNSIDCSGAILGVSGYFANGLTSAGATTFGTFTSGTITNDGYITITDTSGVMRKLMVGS